ncbi:hypothetical protein KFL_000890070 [Klebsormidium nitens]|uniref:Protein BTN n=1 Tax=Klebsormidium nitens TaxID=105231 RepID=A0A1Y1I0V8_KLENI|nr:hypothetical protein KFL_000890070 [Klebsormidium nitens]|eukprot:GAQ81718.1 hypothetical protein KFL_000890070 [Klebsormidium nitens]
MAGAPAGTASSTPTDEAQEGDGVLLDEESLLRAPQAVKGFTPAKAAGGFHARHLAGFWIGGLINNFSYVVFLTAAEDILTGYSGAVLLADILPTLVIKSLAPFFIHRFSYLQRVAAVVVLAVLAFLIVATAGSSFVALGGVCFASLAAGLGEITFLALSSRYHRSTVGAWSSGTGGAGLAGAGIWVFIRQVAGLQPALTLLVMSPVPLIQGAAYYFLICPGGPEPSPSFPPGSPPKFQLLSDSDSDETSAPSETSTRRAMHPVWTSEESDALPLGGARVEELSGGVVRAGFGSPSGEGPPRGIARGEERIAKGGHGSGLGGAAARGGQNHERNSVRVRGIVGERKVGAARARTLSLKEVYRLVRPLFARYMLPLFLVYYFEYTINQALFLPMGYAVNGAEGAKHACPMYSFLQTTYQVGVFISRSSISFFPLTRLWPLPTLQGLNLVIALAVCLHVSQPGRKPIGIAIAYAATLWEGLLGGATYVNAFTLLSVNTPVEHREFAMGITSLSDSVGVSLAGATALVVERVMLRHLGVSSTHC